MAAYIKHQPAISKPGPVIDFNIRKGKLFSTRGHRKQLNQRLNSIENPGFSLFPAI